MRTVHIALSALGLAGCILAQQSQPTPTGKFYGRLANGFPQGTGILGRTPQPPTVYLRPSQGPAGSTCAVPLLEGQIPRGINFTIVTITPRTDEDGGLIIKPPLPACEKSSPH